MKVRIFRTLACGLFVLASSALGRVDTLKGTTDIEDGVIYSWVDCDGEQTNEDCRRYNAGSITNLQVGNSSVLRERRALIKLPGWNGTVPDSAKFLVYCKG